MVDFGKMSKSFRKQMGMTQDELADLIGITKSVVSFYESRKRTPSPDVLETYANIFHVSTDYMLGLDPKLKLDVSDLNDSEIEAVEEVIQAFRDSR